MDSNQLRPDEKTPATTPTASTAPTPAASSTSKTVSAAIAAAVSGLDALSGLSNPAASFMKTAVKTPSHLSPQVELMNSEISEPISTAPNMVSASSDTILTNKMPGLTEAPVIGNYLDFRKYLADYYLHRREISKKDIRPYNYGVFSAAANIKSPNYLKLIVEGRRNLSGDMIAKFSKALGHSKEQAEEFKLLVLYGQASDPAERNMHLKTLNEKRVDMKIKSGEIDQKTWEKIPSWIAWILYSVIDQKDIQFNAESLRETLRCKASVDEIQDAMDTLLKSGEIVKDETTGEMKKARSLMEAAEDVPVALVRKLQAELMYLGLESLFQDSATEREFGAATLALTKQEFEELRFTLRKIRKDAQKNIGVKRLSSKGERVYQLNLQLFPITK